MSGLAEISTSDVDVIAAFVESRGRCKREEIKSGIKMQRNRVVAAIKDALEAGRLVEDSQRFLAVPKFGYGTSGKIRTEAAGTDKTAGQESAGK